MYLCLKLIGYRVYLCVTVWPSLCWVVIPLRAYYLLGDFCLRLAPHAPSTPCTRHDSVKLQLRGSAVHSTLRWVLLRLSARHCVAGKGNTFGMPGTSVQAQRTSAVACLVDALSPAQRPRGYLKHWFPTRSTRSTRSRNKKRRHCRVCYARACRTRRDHGGLGLENI